MYFYCTLGGSHVASASRRRRAGAEPPVTRMPEQKHVRMMAREVRHKNSPLMPSRLHAASHQGMAYEQIMSQIDCGIAFKLVPQTTRVFFA